MRRVHRPDLPAEIDCVFVIEGDDAHHLVRVLRAKSGDVFAVFDGAGREVEAEVVRVDRRAATLRVVRERVSRRPARDVVLCAAIPRGQRMEWMVEKCTEVGVATIVPLRTARGVRDGASDNQRRRWGRSALEAAKQCGRAEIPAIAEPCSVAGALALVGDRRLLLADPSADSEAVDPLAGDDPIALFIGPEGGFDDAERASIQNAGAAPFSLGTLILRIETAAVVAVHAAGRIAGAPPSATST